MMKSLIVPLVLLSTSSTGVLAFVPCSSGWHSRSTSLLANAKKASKNAKNTGASGGGFGAAPAKTKKAPRVQDDYSAFPALESDVKKTLISFDGDKEAAAEDLPTEMYERLAHIYGFRSFNYLPDDGESTDESITEPAMSFQELLTSGSDEAAPEASDFSDLLRPSLGGDLGDLLSSATGGKAEATSIATPQEVSVSKLPPFEKFKILHVDPLLVSVEDFFTDEECDRYVAMSQAPPKNFDSPLQSRSKTVGKDANAESQRTSTTWYHHYKGVPELMAKSARLFGLDSIDRFEEPQTVRYRRSEKFTWHLDALAPGGDALTKAGQRTATLLVYLTDLEAAEGGATMFRDLGGPDGPLQVRPKKGSALFFFPAAGGIDGHPLDIRTLHCGEAVAEDAKQDKWIAQLWLREKSYQPTAPPGNTHLEAADAIAEYCNSKS